MENENNNTTKTLGYSIGLVLSVFLLSIILRAPGQVIVSAVITLVSFLVAFNVFLPRMEEKFVKSTTLTIITLLINVLFSFMGFSGALFAIVIQFMALRHITHMDFFPAIVLTIIIGIINIAIILGIAYIIYQTTY